MGRFATILGSGLMRRTLGLLLALTIVLFLLNLRRAGERTRRLAEQLSASENDRDIQR